MSKLISKTIYCDDYEEFVTHCVTKMINNDEEFPSLSIIAKFEDAKEIVAELVKGGFEIVSINLHDEDSEGYRDEFVITFDDIGIWCEEFKRGSKYININEDCVYVFNDCSSAILPYLHTNVIYYVEMNDYSGCTDEEDNCENHNGNCHYECGCNGNCDSYKSNDTDSKKNLSYSIDDKDGMHGFTISKFTGNTNISYSFYSSDKIDTDFVNDIVDKLHW